MRAAHRRSPKWRSDLSILYSARGVRGFGDGFAIVLLPAYLSATGFSPTQIGFIAAASLLGTAALTLGVGLIAPRHDLRNLLLIGAGLMACTGAAFANFEHFALLAVVAFLGTINPSTGDIGVLVPLEHAMLARGVADKDRTRAFARYSLVGALSMAAGSLAVAIPDFLVSNGMSETNAFRSMFYFYATLAAVCRRTLPLSSARSYGQQRNARAARPFARDRLQACAAVQHRCICRRICRSIAIGALAVPAFRLVPRASQPVFLLV